MITHAAFPKTLLYCFIGPPRKGWIFFSMSKNLFVGAGALDGPF